LVREFLQCPAYLRDIVWFEGEQFKDAIVTRFEKFRHEILSVPQQITGFRNDRPTSECALG
jgi:hypothetical protein